MHKLIKFKSVLLTLSILLLLSIIHCIFVNLYPFTESLELKDLTPAKTVYKSNVKLEKDIIGIKIVQYYSSKDRIPI